MVTSRLIVLRITYVIESPPFLKKKKKRSLPDVAMLGVFLRVCRSFKGTRRSAARARRSEPSYGSDAVSSSRAPLHPSIHHVGSGASCTGTHSLGIKLSGILLQRAKKGVITKSGIKLRSQKHNPTAEK